MFKGRKTKFDPNMTDTLIGEGSMFEGKMKSKAGIRIEGQLTGDIDCEGDVTIGENGIASSHIKARNIILAGQVNGNVVATGKLTIKATGALQGNLSAAELSIEAGGVFQGSSQMLTKQHTSASSEETSTQRDADSSTIQSHSEEEKVDVLKTW